jgi:acyl carrier protein
VCATLARWPGGEGAPPIGRPIPNTRVYVLDGGGEPVPVGVAGELHIAGEGLARGYLGRPELTAEKFIADPFGAAGARMYRSGDRVRWRADGQIEFLGRIDGQVKLRGFRIELGEIEARLREHPAVREAAATVREDAPGERRLVAYFTAQGEDGADTAALRAHLSARLPDYMVPAAFVRLDALPLTANNKLDRRALPAPEGEAFAAAAYEPPAGALEETLAQIWAECLGLERVGRHDNFFELGGHSLLAARVIALVRERLGAELPLQLMFASPTVAQLAAGLGDADTRAALPPLAPQPRGAAVPLSFSQERLWFLDQLQPGQTAYNQPAALRLDGALDVAALEASLTELVRRHEVLRTRFEIVGGEAAQRIDPPAPFRLPVTDLSGLAADRREAEAARLAARRRRVRSTCRRGRCCGRGCCASAARSMCCSPPCTTSSRTAGR